MPRLRLAVMLSIAVLAATILSAQRLTACCTGTYLNYINDLNNTQQPTAPQPPPQANDTCFVASTGSAFYSSFPGCRFRTGGVLSAQIPITRCVGNKANLKSHGLLPEYAELKICAWDVDTEGEIDTVSFNGHTILPLQQTSTDCIADWNVTTYQIPIDWITFPEYDPSRSSPEPENQEVKVGIDVNSPTPKFCTALAWMSLTMSLPRPIILVHGVFAGSSTWSTWTGYLDGLGLLHYEPDLFWTAYWMAPIQFNGSLIGNKINDKSRAWGVDRVNMICHSKGGVDSRVALENTGDKVDKIAFIGTPNGGTPVADSLLWIAFHNKRLERPLGWIASPGGRQMSRHYMYGWNQDHGRNGANAYLGIATDCDASQYTGGFINDPHSWGLRGVQHFLVPFANDGLIPAWSVTARGLWLVVRSGEV